MVVRRYSFVLGHVVNCYNVCNIIYVLGKFYDRVYECISSCLFKYSDLVYNSYTNAIVGLFVWVLWHINNCWLFNAKSILIQINSSVSSN